jgi:tetratricopeptide (TPR) repeat protein
MSTKMKNIIGLVFLSLLIIACNKKALLKENPNDSIVVPTTPGDMQALLDHEDVFAPTTYLNFLSADEFYMVDSVVKKLRPSEQGAYLWDNFNFDKDEKVGDWNNTYEQVYYANNVLEGVSRLRGSIDSIVLTPLEGDALFKRSFAFFNVAQVFALPYDSATADTAKGIPLRLTVDPREVLPRSSIAKTYQQIIGDLTKAVNLLPPSIEHIHRNRSSRPAAYALLARVYLSMGAYAQALSAAKKSLDLYDTLINYKTVSGYFPFTATNAETLYQSKMPDVENGLLGALFNNGAFVDSNLVREYKPGDLRPLVFFVRSVPPTTLKGSYYGLISPFTGLGTAELYLIVAECSVQQNDINTGLLYLNNLLKSRWKAGQYTPYTAATTDEALNVILTERRKELVFRGVRWTDIRRLNKTRPLTLSRTVQGYTFKLPPNSLRYALPIPEQVIRLNNRIVQNPR